MQNCRPLSFLHTNTMALHQGLWLGWKVPASNISFTWEWTSMTIGGGILLNISLKGLSSMTVISCFARSVQPNSPGSKEKMSWYSISRACTAAQFLADHPSSPDKSSSCKSASFLCPVDILTLHSQTLASHLVSPMFLAQPLPRAPHFLATTHATLTPLAMVIRAAAWFFTTTATHLFLVVISV